MKKAPKKAVPASRSTAKPKAVPKAKKAITISDSENEDLSDVTPPQPRAVPARRRNASVKYVDVASDDEEDAEDVASDQSFSEATAEESSYASDDD